jgi:hypothetical protein
MRLIQFTQYFHAHSTLGFIQSVTDINIGSRSIIFLGIRARPVRKTKNFTAIYEPIVYTMSDSQNHKPIDLQASLQG